MSNSTEPLTTKTIIEMSQRGVALTGDLEEILLHDTTSIAYKEHMAILMNEIQHQIDIDNLALHYQKHHIMLEKLEEQVLAEKAANAADIQNKLSQQTYQDYEKTQHQLIPTKIVLPRVSTLQQLAEFVHLHQQISQTQLALQDVQTNQQNIQNQWQHQQQQEAHQFIQALNQTAVRLPNGDALPINLAFDPDSLEAQELEQRLSAVPMVTDMLNTLKNTDMRNIYDNQVTLQEKKIQRLHPELDISSEELVLAARQQAIYDLKLDLRQLQNKFMMSITAIHDYMSKLGGNAIDDLVRQYNQALGIDIDKDPRKKIGIYKILDHTISPYLKPKLTMANRNRNALDNLDLHDLQTQALRELLQEKRLQQQNLAQLSTLRALLASFRHVANENPAEFGFLDDICDRVTSPKAPARKNNFRLVPKGYNLK